MAIDGKYGRVTLEHGEHIPDDEPVVVFRGRDMLLPTVLAYYGMQCMEAGSPLRHLRIVAQAYQRITEWQKQNPPEVPTSETSRAWME